MYDKVMFVRFFPYVLKDDVLYGSIGGIDLPIFSLLLND